MVAVATTNVIIITIVNVITIVVGRNVSFATTNVIIITLVNVITIAVATVVP